MRELILIALLLLISLVLSGCITSDSGDSCQIYPCHPARIEWSEVYCSTADEMRECTADFQEIDKCAQYLSCQAVHNGCQVTKDSKYDSCRDCFNECYETEVSPENGYELINTCFENCRQEFLLPCVKGYSNETRCNGDNIERLWNFGPDVGCRTEWRYDTYCEFGCENGQCKDPEQLPEENITITIEDEGGSESEIEPEGETEESNYEIEGEQEIGTEDEEEIEEDSEIETDLEEENMVEEPEPETEADSTELDSGIEVIEPLQSDVPEKFLTVIAVGYGGSGEHEGGGCWERKMTTRETDDFQTFEVVMWDNGIVSNPKIISVYKFDNTFDPFNPDCFNGDQAWLDYRESYNILNVNVVPPSSESCETAQGAEYYECSQIYTDAFKLIIRTVMENQPAEHYGIKYLGHGSGDGSIFQGRITQSDAEELFSYINLLIEKKLDFLDWGFSCSMGTYQIASSQYPYADYILGSDLRRGFIFVGDNNYDYYRLKPEPIYEQFFSPSKSIRQSLTEMLDSERMLWESSPTREQFVLEQHKQSLSIYDSNKFEDLMISADLESMPQGDVLEYIIENYPEEEHKFYDFRFHYISTKDFFPWDINSNGLKKK